MKLIAGLGNIGAQYAATRHNIGFMIVDELAHQHAAQWSTDTKHKAEIATITQNGEKILLVKPQTMMNLSGEAIGSLMRFYKLSGSDVWLVFDDVDVPFGKLRLRVTGSAGGHQGVRSAIAHIGPDFTRVRIGISLNDRSREPSEIYVLKPFNPDEREQLPGIIHAAAQTIQDQLSTASPEEITISLL